MPLYTATDTGHQSSASEYSIKYPPPLLAPPPPNLLENINLDSVFFLPFILLSPLSPLYSPSRVQWIFIQRHGRSF